MNQCKLGVWKGEADIERAEAHSPLFFHSNIRYLTVWCISVSQRSIGHSHVSGQCRQRWMGCPMPARVCSHHPADPAPSSGQRCNERNHFPSTCVILSTGNWEMEMGIHIALAGHWDLSYTSTELPYLEFSVTKDFGILWSKLKK